MVEYCHRVPCCTHTNYKKCENILCGNGEDSMQCRIPKTIKSIDCFCIIMENNCINNEENSGLEEDEGEKQIWVENGCRGWFRVCYKKEKQCQPNGTHITDTQIPLVTTPRLLTSRTHKPLHTTYLPNTSVKSGSINNTGLLLGLPLALVFAVMVILVLVYIRCKSKKKTAKQKNQHRTNGTYMNNIKVDDDVVYDEISDDKGNKTSAAEDNMGNKTSAAEDNMGNKTSAAEDNMGNKTSAADDILPMYTSDPTDWRRRKKVPNDGIQNHTNGNYFVSEKDESNNEETNYYVTPSETNYFVLDKHCGEHDQQNASNNERNCHQLSQTDDTAGDYFVLEKEYDHLGTNMSQHVESNCSTLPTDDRTHYFELEKENTEREKQ